MKKIVVIEDDGSVPDSKTYHKATSELNDRIDDLMCFWKHGTAVHEESVAALEFIEAIKKARN